jgi:gluconolactonase
VSVQTLRTGVGVIHPADQARVLAANFEGTAFGRPNDLVIGRGGDLYFTDPGLGAQPGQPAPPTAVYQLRPGGKLRRVAAGIERPNGVALSPDEAVLYVANTQGDWLLAFDLGRDAGVGTPRNFARIAGVQRGEGGAVSGGADGLAVDAQGRVYVATGLGVQVFDPAGTALGVIALPKAPQNLAFGGPRRDQLYVVGRGSVYRIPTLTSGPAGRAK